MTKIETSFWGSPTCEPQDKDVAYFIELIRTTTQDYSDARALQIATSALQAIVGFVAHRNGPKEALALIDRLRSEIIEG